MALQRARHAAIEIGRREFHRMRRDYPRVETIEPARIPVIPRAVLDNDMIVDAIASRLGERAVGDLVHPHGARRGTVYLEGPGVEGPAPVGAHHRIAGTLDLRERRE